MAAIDTDCKSALLILYSPSTDEIHKGVLRFHFEGQQSNLEHKHVHVHRKKMLTGGQTATYCLRRTQIDEVIVHFLHWIKYRTNNMMADGLTVPEFTYFFFLLFFLGFKTCW